MYGSQSDNVNCLWRRGHSAVIKVTPRLSSSLAFPTFHKLPPCCIEVLTFGPMVYDGCGLEGHKRWYHIYIYIYITRCNNNGHHIHVNTDITTIVNNTIQI